jgi:hypothetical protein
MVTMVARTPDAASSVSMSCGSDVSTVSPSRASRDAASGDRG